ncbi:TetR family transcriptional regulator [Conexibacter sp. W3-3-2]|nr:TetR family transcriptional regulator [Conexibacter sp. W3-3-2]
MPETVASRDEGAQGPQQERSRLTRLRLLDGAVEVLARDGYAGLSTPEVSRRAGVSRGAQQGHFPTRLELVRAVIHELTDRQTRQLERSLAALPGKRPRPVEILDIAYQQYGGELFRAILELSLAARSQVELRSVIDDAERTVGRAITALREQVAVPTGGELDPDRWATAISASRGTALLRLLGHPVKHVDRQWAASREHLAELLIVPSGAA